MRQRTTSSKYLQAIIIVALVAVTVCAFAPVLRAGFIDKCDDAEYVTSNRQVQAGLTAASVAWAFTTMQASNWHPLTWISHMADVSIYGMNPAGHHATNLLLHVASTILLFIVLYRLTGSLWPSAFAAALFGVHPMHVESVAWVAERKDVLSTFLMMLTMLAYSRYVRNKRAATYIPVVLLFALGLLAKPMLVTLPFVLLLLDYWPLARHKTQGWARLAIEKSPLFALSIASSIMTYVAQHHGGATSLMASVPLNYRIANAFISYVEYIVKMFAPVRLAMFYPHPGTGLSLPLAAGAGILIVALTAAIFAASRQRPFLAAGWLWYLVTLVPVIGIVQVGGQAMADRYSYIPFVGLFIILCWGVEDFFASRGGAAAVAAGVAVVGTLSVLTFAQAGTWRSNVTVFQHAVDVVPGNWFCYNNLGNALLDDNRIDEAIANYEMSLKFRENYELAHTNLSNALAMKGDLPKALQHAEVAIRLAPDSADANNNLGNCLAQSGRIQEAIPYFTKAIKLNPDIVEAHHNLGLALYREGKVRESIVHYREALRLNPKFDRTYGFLALALSDIGDYAGARETVRSAETQGQPVPSEIIAALSRKSPRQ